MACFLLPCVHLGGYPAWDLLEDLKAKTDKQFIHDVGQLVIFSSEERRKTSELCNSLCNIICHHNLQINSLKIWQCDFLDFFFFILSLIAEVYLWWKLQASHLFKWENLHNWWLTKYFFAPLYIYTQYNRKQWNHLPAIGDAILNGLVNDVLVGRHLGSSQDEGRVGGRILGLVLFDCYRTGRNLKNITT